MKSATTALSALSQDLRLETFRLLMQRGPEGMLAGALAEALETRANTMSANLAVLLQAGLVSKTREGRSIRYTVELSRFQALLTFLLQDCCGGRPDLCGPLLRDLTKSCKAPPGPAPEIKNVLFLCTGNSARSIIAEAILNREGHGTFRGFSAGSTPQGTVHPYTLELLEGLGHDIGFARSKSWTAFAPETAPNMDFVITVCDSAAAEPCPTWPGQPVTAHWSLPDPAQVTGTEAAKRLAFAETYRMLRNRITTFVALPLDELDRLSLGPRIDAIGPE